MKAPIDERQDGFTLIEALLAIAIVAMVVTTVLSIRTGALIDANEARNWRVAREVAQEILSELAAGARDEVVDYRMVPQPIPTMTDVEDWSYQIVIGETPFVIEEETGDVAVVVAFNARVEIPRQIGSGGSLRRIRFGEGFATGHERHEQKGDGEHRRSSARLARKGGRTLVEL